MITIEKAQNGYIVRIDDEETLVFQQEFNSKNVALGAVCRLLLERYGEDENVTIKIDVVPQ